MRTRWTLLVAGALVAACAPAGVRSSSDVGSHNRDVVTAAELAGTHSANLDDALRQLRPEFFTARGVSSIRQGTPDLPTVYLDGTKLGGLETLRNIDIGVVLEVRRLTPREATIRLGTDSPGGVLLVTTAHRS
jgi:hypothetical protein